MKNELGEGAFKLTVSIPFFNFHYCKLSHLFVLCLAGISMECNEIQLDRERTVVIAYSTLLAVMGTCGFIFTPLFKKYLQFAKFIIFFLQMVAVLFFLSVGIILHAVFDENLFFYMHNKVTQNGGLGVDEVVMLKKVVSFFKSFFYLLFYFLSMMQSLDLYIMI